MRLFGWVNDLIALLRTHKEYDFGTRYQTIVIPNLGVMNRNHRIYTVEIAKKMCGQLPWCGQFGQIGYPDSPDISLLKASHVIHRVFLSGNDLWAEYSVLDNDNGRLLYDLFKNVGQDAFVLRSRGKGSIRNNGFIEDDYVVFTYDFIPVSEDAFRPFTDEDVIEYGTKVFGESGKLYRWLVTTSPYLHNKTPRNMMQEGRHGEVMSELANIEYGAYA